MFDVPDAATMQTFGINNTGHVVGKADIPAMTGTPVGGFLRFPDGSFDAPIRAPGAAGGGGTMVVGINDAGHHVGWWSPPQPPPPEPTPTHGLFRPLGGPIQTIDRPGASLTQFFGINNRGEMIGDSSIQDVGQAFLRLADGTFQDIDCPAGSRTHVTGINDAGYTVGRYFSGATAHGYVRSPNGTCTVIPVANAWPRGINHSGQVVGTLGSGGLGSPGFIYNSLSD